MLTRGADPVSMWIARGVNPAYPDVFVGWVQYADDTHCVVTHTDYAAVCRILHDEYRRLRSRALTLPTTPQ